MTSEVLGPRALGRATLARQLLLERSSRTVPETVEHLVGLQAQAPWPPYYGLWCRVRDFRPDDLARLLLDRSVVRMVLLRGTVHLVTAADALRLRPWVQPLLDRGVGGGTEYAPALVGLDLDDVAAAGRELLADGPLTGAELAPLLGARWPDRDPAALSRAVRDLLPLVQVPPRAVWGRGGQPRLATVEAWLGRPLQADPEARGIVRRYLAAFGPATVADVRAWSGLTGLGPVVEALRPELRTFADEHGRELFDLPHAPRPEPATPAPARLLAPFDNLLLSHADRTRVIGDAARSRVITKNGQVAGTVLLDGMVAGAWQIRRSRGAATVRVRPFRPFSTAEHAGVEREAADLLAVTGEGADAADVVVEDPT